jgi:hypothetical protein
VPKKKTTAEFVAAARAVHGDRYDYSKVAYVNNQVRVTIVCPDHGAFEQVPSYHTDNGAGCPACSGNKRVTTADFVAESKKVHGDRYDYSLVAVTTNTTPVQIVCPDHGVFLQAPKQHRKGQGCPTCGGTQKLDQGVMLTRFAEVHGARYDYSKAVYTSAREEVTIVCPDHGEFSQIAALHWGGRGCPKCAKRVLAADLRKSADEVQLDLQRQGGAGFTYDVSGYTNNKGFISVTCDRGHVFEQRVNDAKRYGCPSCAGRNSAGEGELRAFIQSLGVEPVKTRKIAPPKEVDMWCPEQKVGFEFNGLYWHSDAIPGGPTRHKDKSDAVRANGGSLVHIWSDDWALRRNAVEHLVMAKLGKLPTVGARTCTVRPVPVAIARSFLESYHLQGWTSADYIGLWHGDELLACMGFAVARSIRGNTDPTLWELVRYAAKVRVAGGGSRLLKAWLSAAGTKWERLVTYCDLAQFDGGLYRGMGFTETGRSGPDYKVLKAGDDQRLHKSAVQKAKLAVLLGDKYDATKTEAQLCAENHIFRVWDCGRVRYELHRVSP